MRLEIARDVLKNRDCWLSGFSFSIFTYPPPPVFLLKRLEPIESAGVILAEGAKEGQRACK